MPSQEALEDFRTHAANWREAILIAMENAAVSPPDIDDRSYWEHQLRAFDRVAAGMGIPSENPILPDNATPREKLEELDRSAQRKFAEVAAFGISYSMRYHINTLTAAEQAGNVLWHFHAHVCNGGMRQYIEHGHAFETGSRGTNAASVVTRLATEFKDVDPELAALVRDLAKMANDYHDFGDHADDVADEIEALRFKPLEDRYYAMDVNRVFGFFASVAEGLDPGKLPFRDGIYRAPAPAAAPAP